MWSTAFVLVLVRHGRTAANAQGLLQGRLDLPLDELGHAQAAELAKALGRPSRVVSSPLRRSRQTAEALGVEVELDERWTELDYGDLDGLPVELDRVRGVGPLAERPPRSPRREASR